MNQDALTTLADEAIRIAQSRRVVPMATYRLQMHAGFTLKQACQIVPYLHQLGISHLYVSSLVTAQPGSLHGYDVVNHGQLNPELGTEADLEQLAEELHRNKMGLILDVVPNHMRVGPANEWWMDVLENGPSSRFADYFDISWQNHPSERLHGKVLLPILDEPYGKAIRAGRLRPDFADGAFSIAIDQNRLPLDPRTFDVILEPVLETFRAEHGEEAPSTLELQSILSAVRHLPRREDRDPSHISAARAEEIVIKRRLRELAMQQPSLLQHIEAALRKISGDQSNAESLTTLIELLDAQAYRPCFWRVALDEINYRRFFDVNELAALAAENPEVFRAVHAKPFQWFDKRILDGLRIDHVDGLLDPQEYLDRLQLHCIATCARDLWKNSPERFGTENWETVEPLFLTYLKGRQSPLERSLFVVVEKILGPREALPARWSCDGTTGYEFLNELNGLFIDSSHGEEMTAVYHQFTRATDGFDQIAYEAKRQILRTSMTSELNVLAHRLDKLAQADWWSRDFTLNGLRHALEEFIACFPVYRSYVVHEAGSVDRVLILRAARRARNLNPLLGRDLFDFIRDTLLLKDPVSGTASPEYREKQKHFVGKFQQLTAPVMAKGVEDTAFYTYNRLLSLNEVGGEPARFGRTPDELHAFLKARATSGVNGLSPLSTHDTKRGEDVRTRINVLSEIPQLWKQRLKHWHSLNRHFKGEFEDGVLAPDENEEVLLYQTLIGAWPGQGLSEGVGADFVTRIQAFMTKAIREAKSHSSWINPQTEYDQAVATFVQSILDHRLAPVFLSDFNDFQQRIRWAGRLNSLSQTLIRCTAPGIPDTYQGTEMWDDSLVDPDNRRPVDYELRQQLLKQLQDNFAQTTELSRAETRRMFNSEGAKMWVTMRALRLRGEHPELFQHGDYTPLIPQGADRNHVFGFLRHHSHRAVLVVVPRLVTTLAASRQGTDFDQQIEINAELTLPEEWHDSAWRNIFSGAKVRPPGAGLSAATLLADSPVGLWTTI